MFQIYDVELSTLNKALCGRQPTDFYHIPFNLFFLSLVLIISYLSIFSLVSIF